MSHLLKKLAFTEVYNLNNNNQVTLLFISYVVWPRFFGDDDSSFYVSFCPKESLGQSAKNVTFLLAENQGSFCFMQEGAINDYTVGKMCHFQR